MKLSALKTNVALVEAGRWVENIPGMGDLRLRVRGGGNKDLRALQERLIAAVPHEKRIRGLDVETGDRIDGECLARAALLDWENLTDDTGTVIPYEPGLALEMLTDPQFAIFRRAVQWATNAVTVEDEATAKEEVGKSSPPSNGTTSGVTS